MHAIGIDIGTSNVKAVLLDVADGTTLATSVRGLRWERAGDLAEQDAMALWDAVVDSVREVVAGAARVDVEVIGLCGQYSSIVPVDGAVQPLAPMRLYFDQRGTPHCREVLARHPEAFLAWVERHPIPPVGGGLALGHLLALQHDAPDVHARTAAYLEAVDYVTARLTGELVATQASVYAGQLVDNRSLGATGYDPELAAMAGVDVARLPRLVPIGSAIGTVVPELAAEVGLSPDTVVITGLTDSAGGALATGAERVGRVGAAIGTTGVVLSSADAMGADFDHEVFAMPGASRSRYLVSGENGIAGRAVEHVLGPLLGRPAVDPFEGFEEALAASPPGCRGVRFLPWLSGSMSPANDTSVRGGFVGLSLDSERVDLVRATAEGVAHNLRWLLGPVESFTGEVATEVVLTGGAARSPGWCQVVADILERPVHALADPGTSGARASARWAAAQLDGSGGEGDDALAAAATYLPDASTAGVHAEAHGQFVAAFDALRPLALGARP